MPIADCGFRPFAIQPNRSPPVFQPVNAAGQLYLSGPTVPVEIGFESALYQESSRMEAVQQIQARPSTGLVPALLDTGSRESCIDADLARELNLPVIDRQQGAGVGGVDTFDLFLAYLRVPSLGFLEYGRFMGVRLRAGGQPHLALLGRSTFQRMVLVYDGRDGSCRLAI